MLNEKSITLELGSGFGNDALLIARNSKAHVTAVDKADAGIKAAQKELRKPDRKEYLRWIETGLRNIADRHGQDFGKTRAYLHSLVLEGRCTADVIMKEDRIGLEGDKFKEEIAKCIGQMNSARADFGTEDYRDTLESYYRMGLTMIYSLSTLHYILPHVLEEEISPMIADALRDEEGNPTGVFCVGMKLAGSASAQSSDQIRLAPGSKYNPSYHTVDGIARIYPETKEDVIALFPDFDVIDCKVEDNPDYDKKGDVEKMCQLILRPKQGKPVRQGEAAKMAKAA